MPSIELSSGSGKDPAKIFVDLDAALTPNFGDMQLAGQLVRSDIRERCEQGVDVDGVPFEPYSTNGPYYYNPGTRGGKFEETSGATGRLHKKLEKAGAKTLGISRTGRTIKFESYAAFKAAFGRPGVDLLGVSPPHMLDAIVVRVNGVDVNVRDEGETAVLGGLTNSSPAFAVSIGIYDEAAAARASGHQFGTRTLPQRRFFGASAAAVERIKNVLQARIMLRAQRALGR